MPKWRITYYSLSPGKFKVDIDKYHKIVILIYYMDWQTHKKQLLKNSNFRKALKKDRLEYDIARAIIKARIKYQLTQKQLAKKLHTRQSVISRVENAQTTASVSFLQRLAGIFGGKLKISFNGI